MDKVVVFFQPFSIKQNVIVYKNGEIINSAKVEIDRVSKVVKGFCSQYSIYEVDLKGNQDYLEKYKTEILTNYSSLNINVI